MKRDDDGSALAAGAADAAGGGRGGRPFPDSLCWRCANHRTVAAARSTFLMCTGLPLKYPRQPVAACPAFRAGQTVDDGG